MSGQRVMTFGVVVGNRGFFPDHLAKSGREQMIAALKARDLDRYMQRIDDSYFGESEMIPDGVRGPEGARFGVRSSTPCKQWPVQAMARANNGPCQPCQTAQRASGFHGPRRADTFPPTCAPDISS